MFQILEQSLLQTLRWQVDVATPIDFLILLLAIRARLHIDEGRKPKFFSSASFGSKDSSSEENNLDTQSSIGQIESVLPCGLIMTILCLSRKYLEDYISIKLFFILSSLLI